MRMLGAGSFIAALWRGSEFGLWCLDGSEIRLAAGSVRKWGNGRAWQGFLGRRIDDRAGAAHRSKTSSTPYRAVWRIV